MQNTKLNHPTEDELERYILNRGREEELERLETHILACESCVTRLEDLEFEIRVTKLALQDFRREQLAKAAVSQESSWKTWFRVPKLSLTGAVATVALGLIVVPTFLPHRAPVAEVTLSAFRGEETSVVPAGHRLDMHLNTADLAEGPVLVAVVDIRGVEVWKGSATIHDEQAEVMVPPITERGAHFLRLYASTQASLGSDLLREFAFQVQ
jgi:anti-sigma factor RsiW